MTVSNLSTGMRPGVCLSSSRPTVPYEGQMVYETDTDMVAIWNGTAWRYIAATTPTNGTVLQIVSGSYTTQTANLTSTFADTGLSLAITPKSSSSKVLVIVTQAGCYKEINNTWLQLKLMRGATGGTELAQFESYGGYTGTTAALGFGSCSTTYLDSPATTSATTYRTTFASGNNSQQVIVQTAGARSTITLMEISG